MTSELRPVVEVEQIDRDAGADFMGSIPAFYGQEQPMRDGLHDTSLIVQAFARHRRQARAEVVGEIVAWLRKGEKPFSDCDCAAHLLETGEWKL